MLDCIEVLKTSKKVLCAPLLCDRVAWSYCNCITFLNSQTSILLYQLQKHLPHRSTHNTKFIYICMQYSKVANLEKTSFFHSIWPTQPAKAPKLFPFGQATSTQQTHTISSYQLNPLQMHLTVLSCKAIFFFFFFWVRGNKGFQLAKHPGFSEQGSQQRS